MTEQEKENRHIVISIVERESGLEMSAQIKGFDTMTLIGVLEFQKQQIIADLNQKMEQEKREQAFLNSNNNQA